MENKSRRQQHRIEQYFNIYYITLTLIVAVVTVHQLEFAYLYQTNEKVMHSTLNYEAFRQLELPPSLIQAAVEEKEKDYIAYITYEMLAHDFNLSKKFKREDTSVWKQISVVENSEVYEELYYYYQILFSDLKYFPVPLQKSGMEKWAYDNSWGASRTFGGKRTHEGCDIMTSNNKRGFFPILSVSDGVVEKMGWLSQGGYRIGIRSKHGAYFYYAHLYEYAPELEEGDEVKAGQLLGFMGDSGYGEEGTIGQFDVHLHFGIYLNSKEGEMSVNPYWVLKYLETKKLTMDF